MYRRIRDLREDRDLKQKEIADYLNCSQVCYSHYELGKRDIPTEILIKLAKFYKTSTDYILGLTDDIQRLTFPGTGVLSKYAGGIFVTQDCEMREHFSDSEKTRKSFNF